MLRKLAKKTLVTFVAGSLLFGMLPSPLPAQAEEERVIWSYLYMGPNHTASQALEMFKTQVLATGGVVDIVSPNWFGLNGQQGEITDRAIPEFVEWAHQRELKVVPMVNKDWSNDDVRHMLKLDTRRATFINNIMSAIEKYNLDGINIDFEGAGLDEPEKETLALLMEELTARLHEQGKISSIAVMSKQADNTPSWLQEYDYARLGKAVDYLIIMAYDQNTSVAGPNAGYRWVKQTAEYAASVVEPEKILLGAPLYGRRWMEGQKGSVGVSYPNLLEAKDIYNFEIKWDEPDKSFNTIFKDNEGKQRTIWFDNDISLGYKMHLADDLDFGGAAFWRLGFEDTTWWPELDAHLQGAKAEAELDAKVEAYKTPAAPVDPEPTPIDTTPKEPEEKVVTFPDTEKHWSKLDVSYLVNRKVIGGFPDGTFKPEANVTRAQLAAMLSRALNLPIDQEPKLFQDVPADHPMAQSIYAVKKAGIIGGYDDGTFKPNAQATRAEVAKMLDLAFALKGKTDQTFTDVKAGFWAEAHIKSLAGRKITVGFPDGSFKPQANTTRAEIAAFLKRCLETQAVQVTKTDSADPVSIY